MKGKLKGLLAGAVLFFAMTLTVQANPSGSEDLPSRMIMTPTINLNVRNAPGMHGSVVASIKPGEKVTATSNNGGWFMITYNDNAYFAWGKYLSYVSEEDGSFNEQHAGLYRGEDLHGNLFNPQKPNTPVNNDQHVEKLDLMMQATTGVNIRETPNGKIVGSLSKGQDIHVVGNRTDVGWYKCEKDGKTVYIYDDYLIPEFPQTMKSTAALNVRVAPGTNQTIIGSLKKGDAVKVSGEENGWFKFTYEKTGQIGYSSAQYLIAVN